MIKKTLNMRKVILARGGNITRDTGGIKVSGELVPGHRECHGYSVANGDGGSGEASAAG